jgi:hypothetical protein
VYAVLGVLRRKRLLAWSRSLGGIMMVARVCQREGTSEHAT